MATSLRDLRIQARRLGATNAREMDEDELEEYIEEHSSKNGKKKRATVKRGVTKKAKTRKVVEEDDDDDLEEDDEDEEEEAPRKRGRPKGSKNKIKKTATKKRTRKVVDEEEDDEDDEEYDDDDDEDEAPRRRGRPKDRATTKRAAARKSSRGGKVGRPPGSGNGTRVTLSEEIDWFADDDFSFREGSTAQYILEAVQKQAEKYEDTSDIREAVIEKLLPKVGQVDELIFMDRSTGRKKKGSAAEDTLRYRVSRTMLDYAINTDQHDGATATTARKPKAEKTSTRGKNKVKRGPGRPRKVVEDDDEDEEEITPRRGRPKGSKNKTTSKRGPGRPKGSKNKSKKRSRR